MSGIGKTREKSRFVGLGEKWGVVKSSLEAFPLF